MTAYMELDNKHKRRIFLMIGLFATLIITILSYTVYLTAPVKYDFNIECNSGDIDFGIFFNEYLNVSSSSVRLDGVDGLSCKIEGSLEAPLHLITSQILLMS